MSLSMAYERIAMGGVERQELRTISRDQGRFYLLGGVGRARVVEIPPDSGFWRH